MKPHHWDDLISKHMLTMFQEMVCAFSLDRKQGVAILFIYTLHFNGRLMKRRRLNSSCGLAHQPQNQTSLADSHRSARYTCPSH